MKAPGPAPTTGEESAADGLGEDEVLRRRARGEGNNLSLSTSRSYAQILRANFLSVINLILFILGLLLVNQRAIGTHSGGRSISVMVSKDREVFVTHILLPIDVESPPSDWLAGDEKGPRTGETILDGMTIRRGADAM